MAVLYPDTILARAELYANALDEVRLRLRAIAQIQESKAVPPLFAQEFCHMMLRLACECFAVGCLAAQGDFKTNKAFRDEYTPALIFKALEKNYPAFFPTPASLKWQADHWHFDANVQRPAITRATIEALWNKSGGHLHRASAKRYVSRTNEVTFDQINKAADEFWGLIIDHSISLAMVEPSKGTILHVTVDRGNDVMGLHFLHVDKAAQTVSIQEFKVVTARAS